MKFFCFFFQNILTLCVSAFHILHLHWWLPQTHSEKSNATFGPGLCSIQGLCLQFRNRNHSGQWQSWFGRGMGGAQNVAKVWNTDNPDILWLLSISVLFVVFAFIPQVEMEHAESWEDYELQLACWSMFSKPLFKFLLRFKIQHMWSIPLPHSCAAYLSMKTKVVARLACACYGRNYRMALQPVIHISTHIILNVCFTVLLLFVHQNLATSWDGWNTGWFSWDTLDMKWWLPGWISRYQRWIGIQKAGVFFSPQATRWRKSDPGLWTVVLFFPFGHGIVACPCFGFICFETIKQRTSGFLVSVAWFTHFESNRPWPTTTTDGHSSDDSPLAMKPASENVDCLDFSFLCRVRQRQWYVSSWWTIPATLLSLFWAPKIWENHV